MPKTRQQKEEIVRELADYFRRMKAAVFTSIGGYTMADADKLREKGREQGVTSFVAKKTLLERALKEAGIEADMAKMEGSLLTSVGFEDEVSAAKIIAAFAKDREAIKMVGGVLEGKLVDAKAVKTLATLPSKEELLAKLVGSLNAPVFGFVNVLAGNLRGLVTVLGAIKDKKVA
jgi:large subunit ribosomal protein L10